ncbi:unnamed protein product [Mytilus coruscus]|uniref:Uncharacterized protein n=1 Tax=Mytilus coruscus TaxID=42192 RepID=A0A6J8A4T1_MYTCO|nr:unnamed protein product [Mytilus coruscus]
MATDSPCEDEIKRAIKKKDVETILRLCDDSSYRKSILDFRKDGRRLVHLAAQFGSVILLEKLRSIGSELTVLSHDTYEHHNGGLYTTLHIACACGHIEVVKYLLQTVQNVSFKNLATIQGKDKNYRNAFYYAAQSGSVEVVKCLQTLGKLDINEILPHKKTTLSVVVAEQDSASAQILCECGANVNLGTFERGLKPIQYIVEKPNSAEIIKVLLNFGANVNEPWERHSRRSWLRQSPLFMALKHGFADNAKILIEGGANVSFVGQGANLGSISCFSLAAKRCPALISEFLKHGADPNESLNDQSLFMMAMDDYASNDTIKAFVEAGADVNQHRNGKTLIQSCTCYEQLRPFIEGGVSVKIIESKHKVYTISLALESRYTSDTQSLSDLLSKGADPNLKPEGKDPPLIVATKNNLSEDVECLIKGGAQLDDVSRDGDTAIVVCCKKVSHSCFQTLNILIDSGASLNIASNEGEYPLELLAQRIEKDKHSGANLMRHLFGYESSHIEELENCVTKMLAKGANPNITRKGKNSPLIIAVQKQSEDFVQIMLDAGADILHVGENQRTALELCFIRATDVLTNLFRCFMVSGIEVNKPTKHSIYPLQIPIWLNSFEMTKWALERDADVNIVNDLNNAPLTIALENGHIDIVQLLLDSKANLNFTGHVRSETEIKGQDSEIFDKEVVSLLIKNGAEINKINDLGETALIRYIKRGRQHALEKNVLFLIEVGADPNTSVKDCNSALIEALSLNLFNISICLLKANSNVNHVGANGTTALQVILRKVKNIGTVEILLESGASFYLKDRHGNIPLSLPFMSGTHALNINPKRDVIIKKMLSTLLEKGACPNTQPDGEDTSLMLAAENCLPECVKLLLKSGAHSDHIGKDGKTALHKCISATGYDSPLLLAIQCEDIEAIKALLKAGSNLSHRGVDRLNAFEKCLKSALDGALQFLEYYKEEGGILNKVNKDGNSPLLVLLNEYSKQRDKSEKIETQTANIAAYLMKNTTTEILDKYGNSPLHVAAEDGMVKIIEALLASGANASRENQRGRTALHVCLEKQTPKERSDIIHSLITHGANLNKISTEFRRPLDCLIYRMIKDIRELKKLHDKIHSHQYLKIDLSSFNYLVRCGCELAPIEDIDTTYFYDEYRAPPRNHLGFGVMSSMLYSNTSDSASSEYSASTYPYNDNDLSFEDMIDQALM